MERVRALRVRIRARVKVRIKVMGAPGDPLHHLENRLLVQDRVRGQI